MDDRGAELFGPHAKASRSPDSTCRHKCEILAWACLASLVMTSPKLTMAASHAPSGQFFETEDTNSPFRFAQAGPAPRLPLLDLPPGASTAPPMFTTLMQMGDAAMMRGDITRARAMYERAAAVHPASSSAPLAAGKTYDPNFLLSFGGSDTLANVSMASQWYRRARDLGDPAAATFLSALR